MKKVPMDIMGTNDVKIPDCQAALAKRSGFTAVTFLQQGCPWRCCSSRVGHLQHNITCSFWLCEPWAYLAPAAGRAPAAAHGSAGNFLPTTTAAPQHPFLTEACRHPCARAISSFQIKGRSVHSVNQA